MQLKVIHTLPEMNALSDEWNNLLIHSASHVPFLRHEYLSIWWQTLGGGEWPHGELHTVTARQEDGQLVGIAPLFFTDNRDGEPALMFLGSIEISDYLDVIAPKEQLPTFLDELLDHLDSPLAPAWRVLDWYNLLDSSPTLPALKEAAARKGWSYTEEPLQHCPYIPLPGDWEVYLAGVDKKQRHEIRRKMRRIEENGQPVRWYIVDDEAKLDDEVDEFFRLMEQDPKKQRFLTPIMREQMRAMARAFYKAGWLQLAFVEVGGEKMAVYFNFDYMNQVWVYNSGLDFKYYEYSPGWVLLAYILQWANEQKRECLDFMRGEEDYKYRFGALDRRVVRAIVRR